MKNQLKEVERNLRYIAKRNKSITFSLGLALMYLMLGINAFSQDTNIVIANNQEIVMSAEKLSENLRNIKRENEKRLKESQLELVQLMEQGDQVVKSPWSSWQFGINYMYENWSGAYRGRGDKAEKYPYEGVFTRGEWWERAISPDSSSYSRLIKGNNLKSSLTNNRNAYNYGLVKTKKIKDTGFLYIIEPVININAPAIPNVNVPNLPNLSINPVTTNPNISFSMPSVPTVTFKTIPIESIDVSLFNPPLLNDNSVAFSQGREVGINIHQNYIVSNSTVNLEKETTVSIDDEGYTGSGQYSWDGHSDDRGSGTVSGFPSNRPDAAKGTTTGDTIDARRSNDNVSPFVTPYSDYYNNDQEVTNRPRKFRANPNGLAGTSQQVFMNNVTDGFDLKSTNNSTLIFKNMTSNPKSHNGWVINPTNTIRVVSVNHAYGTREKTTTSFIDTDIKIYGRDGYFDKMSANGNLTNKVHMTVGVEHQAYGSLGARAINNKTMILEKESAKDPTKLGSHLVGMTAMIEDYGDYGINRRGDVNANEGIPAGWYLDGTTTKDSTGMGNIEWKKRRQAPWESTMENRGSIVVNSIDSIGIDFARAYFRADLSKDKSTNISGSVQNPIGNILSYNNKGSLNIYVAVGNIELNNTDPEDSNVYKGTIQGSYGLRVPNLFYEDTKHTNNGITYYIYNHNDKYYDETVIDGKTQSGKEGIVVNGSHNVGASISKIIKGSERVRYYQSGEMGDQTGNFPLSDDGITKNSANAKRHLTTRLASDPIGNIYNLNIKVNGEENVGFLKNSDYMYGNSELYSDRNTYKNDFKIDNSHVETIDFGATATKSILFRTDKYGIDLAMDNFTVTAMDEMTYNIAGNNKKFNIVMLANGEKHSVVTGADSKDNLDASKPVVVKNSNAITLGKNENTGYNLIGLMAHDGGELENNSDIKVNSKKSIALIIQGDGERAAVKKSSSGSSNNATIELLGEESIAVYNNEKNYKMLNGTINAKGERTVGVFSKGENAITELKNSTINISGDSSVGLYATDKSDISLEGVTANVGANSVLFFADSDATSDKTQLKLIGDNNNVRVKANGIAFYLKETDMNSIRENSTTGSINLTLEDDGILSLIEGTGGNLPANTTFNLNSFGTTIKNAFIAPGVFVKADSGRYIPVRGVRTHFVLDKNVNLDNMDDIYLNSEFSSSSVTLEAGNEIKGSGAINSPMKLARKSKVGIAQKNTTVGVGRDDVVLINNGTIDLTGSEMVGIAGEFAEIYNNSIIKTTGNGSVGIITSNGGIANNTGEVSIGSGGIGIAGINYLGVTDNPSLAQPATGEGFIEIVHDGKIVSTGAGKASVGILALDLKERADTGTKIKASQASKVTLGNNSIIDVSSANGSVGVYSKAIYRGGEAKIIDNGAKITVGKDGIGIYSEGTEINATSGIIESINNSRAQGIYTDSDVTNTKEIKLLGDKSIGIHNYGINNLYPTDKSRNYLKIKNSGKITLGNSANLNDPSIGIYTKFGEVEHNNALIEGGKKVVGIYSDVTQAVNLVKGNIKVSDGSIAVYKKQGILNIDGDSLLEVTNNGAAVYSNDGAKVINNSKNIKIGDSSYGFVILDNGINEYTSSSTSKFTMGKKSVYLYKKGMAPVLSETTINAIAGENTAIFGEDGADIVNKGSINFQNGDKNTAFFMRNNSKIINNAVVNLEAKDKNTAFYLSNNSIANNTATLNLQNSTNSTAFYADRQSKINNSGNINFEDSINGTAFYLNDKSEAINNASIQFRSSTRKVTNNVALYVDNESKIINNSSINLENGIGNIGAFASRLSKIDNNSNIKISSSDIINKKYSIGMVAQNGGEIKNNVGAIIEVTGNYGIGMFAEGAGSRAENHGTIKLEGTGELKGAYGMYLNDGAYGINKGIIKSGNYSSDSNKEGLIGVAVMNGATLENHGTIDIDAKNSIGAYIKDGIIKNYGEIKISGANSYGIKSKNGTIDGSTTLSPSNAGTINPSNGGNAFLDIPNVDNDAKAEAGSTEISPTGVVTIEGKIVNIHDLSPGPQPIEVPNFAFSNVGIYIDTLGRTKPINWVDGFDPGVNNDLIIGVEATELTNSKALKIGSDIMSPFINPYKNLAGTSSSILNAISGSLTWTAKPIAGASGYPEEAILAKIPYTDFVDKTENAWNFADGLEQRYDKNELDSREKRLFNKLNSIGKNEQVLLTQAYDEMMGHQYANIQQRIHSTGQILDKEFDYLKDEWRTASKDSNKIKVFGMKGEYSTDTAGIIDYKNNAYGVAYVGENETVKLGKSSGWYTGLVHNKFSFKDIGNSKEEMLQAKLGLFKTTAFDDNGSLNWTISGEAFAGYNKMHRKFLVVDEIFNARSRYWSYGVALKNELSKTLRLSEDFSLRGYASLKAEYGRFQTIKEKSGEVRLDIKANDYISVKPEIGGELIYKTPLSGRNFFNAKLGVKYDNELGRIADAKNKARVAHTNADWFNIRGEKEDRRGNVGADLSLGWDNEAYGITANIGYDTKGKNRRAGLGLRVIF